MSDRKSYEWLTNGRGIPPRLQWSYSTESPLVSIDFAAESGEIIAGDQAGGLYALNRNGRVVGLTRGMHPLSALAWSDAGSGGAVLIGESRLCRLSPRLEVQWSLELPSAVLAIAVDAYGQYFAASLENGSNFIFDGFKQRICSFESVRPLSHLRFFVSEPAIVGAAEYGHLCLHGLDGQALWTEKLWSNVGDLALSGDGNTILVAGFNHGVQVFDGDGVSRGSYVVEGTPHRAAMTFEPDRVIASTVEQSIYWLDADGEMLWASTLPEQVKTLRCDPLGNWALCGLESGRILRLSWDAGRN